jgi:hypothetical protein
LRLRVDLLTLRVAALERRSKGLEKRVSRAEQTIGSNECPVGILYDYVTALRATVVEAAPPPPVGPDLCA